jgi:hypothetical protein
MKFEKFLNKNKCHANINKSLENVKSKENGSQFWTVTHVSLSRICVNYSFGNPSLRQVHAEHESHVASHVKKGGQHLGLLVVDISDSTHRAGEKRRRRSPVAEPGAMRAVRGGGEGATAVRAD